MKQIPLNSLVQHLGLSIIADILISGYRIDSRFVEPGDLFFALKGVKTDGHLYLADAKERGALAAVVDQSYQGPDHGLVLLPVADVAEVLKQLAAFSLQMTSPFVIGVTGSVGKTTTKEFIATLLAEKYSVAKTFGSYNTQLTVPLTILNRGKEEVLVLEMGISQPGDMKKLVQLVPPDLAVLTKVALAHAAFFPGGLEEIAREKMEIFSEAKTMRGVVPSDLQIPFSHTRMVSISQADQEGDYFLSVAEERGFIDERGVRAFSFDLPFQEAHFLHNLLLAVAVSRQMDLSWEEIRRGIERLQLPKMRWERSEYKGTLLINDAYNANPESMRSALSSLPQPKEGGKRIAVLGSMKELGEFSEASHQEIGLLAQRFVDHLLCFGPEAAGIAQAFAKAQKPAEHFLDKRDLCRRLKELMRPADVALLKGSRSLRLEEIVAILQEGDV